jgi:uncharacterized DUF497 family protein
MNKHNKKVLAEMLRNQIVETDAMFKNGDSRDWIIGYLQGTIKIAIDALEDNNIA